MRLMCRQMSHDVRTSAKHYEHIRGVRQAKEVTDILNRAVSLQAPTAVSIISMFVFLQT